MKVSNLIIIAICGAMISCNCSKDKPAEIHLVPQPEKVSVIEENFCISADIPIVYNAEETGLDKAAEYLQHLMGCLKGSPLSLQTGTSQKDDCIWLAVDKNLGAEAYKLSVTADGIAISGGSPRGVFWGIQTLRQMMPVFIETDTIVEDIAIPCADISDAPAFNYRGMHFDVCRHFFSVEEVKQYIDLLAMHKFNTFHWHLTDDQGWRIEIKKYPELTRVGAWRDETVIGRNTGEYDGIRYGGYYTQEQIKEVVAYAEDRFITVIPEIEMPGHALAALASYPELGCTGGPYKVAMLWGVFDDVFCAGNEKTFEFMEDVIDEVCEMFPNSPYIHVGGDECPKEAWKKCPKCQARIKAEKLNNEHELQSYFITRMEKYISGKGKQIIGWDEILEGGLAPGATVMSWRGEQGGIEAARLGHDVIMTPNPVCYFDHYQSKDTEKEPLSIGGFTDCAEVYAWNPVPDSLTEAEAVHILGAQANLWTEYIATFSHAQYMVLPRMAALSEVLWCKQLPGYDSFIMRIRFLMKRYQAAGYNYARHIEK